MPNISRTKTWVANETLTAADLNAEFNGILTGVNDNALNNDNLSQTDDYLFGSLVLGSGVAAGSGDGKLHVHVSSAGAAAHANANDLVVESSANTGITIFSGASSAASIYFGDTDNDVGSIVYTHGTDMAFTVETVEVLTLATASVTNNVNTFVGNGFGAVIGHTAQETISDGGGATDVVPEFQILGTAAADMTAMIGGWSTTATRAAAPVLALAKSGHASIGSHTVVTDGEILGSIIAYGDDGTDIESPAAAIEFAVDGTPGTGDMPGEIKFYTTADGGETLTLGLTLSAAQAATFAGAVTVASLACTAAGTFGGGYGSTGATISTAGVIQANGAITSDGAVTGATLAGTISTAAQNSITSASSLATVGTVTSGTWSTGAVIGGATVTVGSDATGDVYYRNASGVFTRLAVGSDADVLTLASGVPSWATPTTGDITGVTAGTGLSGGGTSGGVTLNVDAAQSQITSVGTLTALTVDDIAVDGKVITMTGSSSDTAVFTVGTNGTLQIVTTDAAAAAANIEITADGTVDINSAGVLTLDSGAAINIEPASGSAILLDGTISIDAGVITGASAITLSGELDAGSLDVSGDANIAGEVQTAGIGYTDGDNAITIADGGGITAAAGITSTAASNSFGATSFGGDVTVANGYGLVIGGTAQISFDAAVGAVEAQVLGTGVADSRMGIARFSADSAGPQLILAKSRNASIGSYTVVQDNDVCGLFGFQADDGTDATTLTAFIQGTVDDGSPASNAIGGDLQFFTYTTSGTGTEAMRIDSSQQVSIGPTASVTGSVAAITSSSSASLSFESTHANAAARNWAFRGADAAHGDLSLLQSTTKGGDAIGGNKVLNFTAGGEVKNLIDSAGFYTGAAGDLRLYHDDTNNWLESGNGQIIIKSNGAVSTRGASFSATNEAGSETMISAAVDGNVKLYYDNGERLRTVSGGVQGFGYADYSGGYYVDSGSYGAFGLIDDASNSSGTKTLYIGNASITVSSDSRVKNNIEDYTDSALDLLDQARVVGFEYDKEGIQDLNSDHGPSSRGRYVGLLAQEAVKWAPWTVNAGDAKDCSLCSAGKECEDHAMIWKAEYDHLVPLTVKALQEAKARIVSLEAQVAALQN
jgi:hypothetical protein